MASTIKVDKLEGSTGSTITVPTGQTLTLTDGLAVSSLPVVTVAKGGTNIASFAAGDVLYATGSTTLAKLTKGTAEQVLAMNSGATAPDWGSVDLTVLPTITVAKGGTNIASFVAGDILYATGTTTLAKLAKGTTLQQLRMNAGATAPEWATITGGTWTKIATADYASGVSNFTITDCFSSTYEIYKVYMHNQYLAADNNDVHIKFLDSSAAAIGNWTFSTNKSYVNDAGSAGSDTNVYGGGADNFYLASDDWSSTSTGVTSCQMTVYMPYEAVNTQVDYNLLLRADNGYLYQWDTYVQLLSSTSARSMYFYTSAGTNFSGYKTTVLGLNR